METSKLAGTWVLTVFCIICCGMFYLCGERAIQGEAIQNKFAVYNDYGKFQWKTNLTAIIVKSYDVETGAIQINRQTIELMGVTSRAMKTILDTGTLMQEIQKESKNK